MMLRPRERSARENKARSEAGLRSALVKPRTLRFASLALGVHSRSYLKEAPNEKVQRLKVASTSVGDVGWVCGSKGSNALGSWPLPQA